jgi:hypothetical protein
MMVSVTFATSKNAMAGLDPAIFGPTRDYRVKPGDDGEGRAGA